MLQKNRVASRNNWKTVRNRFFLDDYMTTIKKLVEKKIWKYHSIS